MYRIEHSGLSCRTIAQALGVRETKATQASRPALDKVARLMILDPVGTWVTLCDAMVQAEQEIIRNRLEMSQPGAVHRNPRQRTTHRVGLP